MQSILKFLYLIFFRCLKNANISFLEILLLFYSHLFLNISSSTNPPLLSIKVQQINIEELIPPLILPLPLIKNRRFHTLDEINVYIQIQFPYYDK